MSLLSWERGLKCYYKVKAFDDSVAPLVGAWIEIKKIRELANMPTVAPLVGAWIEIVGLSGSGVGSTVAPLVGAWIEM